MMFLALGYSDIKKQNNKSMIESFRLEKAFKIMKSNC